MGLADSINEVRFFCNCLFKNVLLTLKKSIPLNMKRVLFLSILVISCSLQLYAQVDAPFLLSDQIGSSIIVKEKSVIYQPNPYHILEINSEIDNKLNTNLIANLDNAKSIKIKQQTQFPLVGFIRSAREFKYDMYIVDYNGKYCLVSRDDVLDNALLDNKNQCMHVYYKRLLDSLSAKEAEYNSLVELKKQEIELELSKINNDRVLADSLVDSIYEAKLTERLDLLQKDYSAWYELLPTSSKKAASILTIQKSQLYSPNSVGGCDYRLRYTNMSAKTIKYLNWYGNVYNAVDDKVSCSVRKTYNFSGRCTGPIKGHQIDDGGWEAIIYNWSAKELRLTKITIIYMDGSSTTIAGTDIVNICNAPECYLSESDMNSLRREAESEVEKEFHNNENIWKDRKKYIEMGGKVYDSTRKETRSYLSDINHLRYEIQELTRKISVFELQNNISVK